MATGNKLTLFAFSLPFALLAATPAHAVALVTYNLAGAPGNQASQAPSAAAANITGLDITRGTGLNASNALNTFSSTGFENTTSGSSTNEFVQLGFTVAPGFLVNLTDLQIATRSSNSGSGTIGLFSSVDSFANPIVTITQPGDTVVQSTLNLAALTNLTGTVTFRFFELGNTQADGVGATAAGGTFRLSNNNSASAIIFNGDVQPFPFEFSPVFGLMAVAAWASRKPIKQKIQQFTKSAVK